MENVQPGPIEIALKIVADVASLPIGGATAAMPTPFQAGYQMACEEIAFGWVLTTCQKQDKVTHLHRSRQRQTRLHGEVWFCLTAER